MRRKPPSPCGIGGERTEHIISEGRPSDSDENDCCAVDEDWDTVFETYLVDETEESFAAVWSYLSRHRVDSFEYYDDLLDAAKEGIRTDGVFALLTIVMHNFATEDFGIMKKLIQDAIASPCEPNSISPPVAADLIYRVCKRASDVPIEELQEFQDFVYSVEWPEDAFVGWRLLRTERQLNQLLPEQRHDFQAQVDPGSPDLEGFDEIQMERMLIMHELANENRVSILWDHEYTDLPYALRKELGDQSEIEDDLIAIIEEWQDHAYDPNAEEFDSDDNDIRILPI